MIATIGFFDGVHLGHQALLQRVVQLAREHNEESAVITFRPHPREVLYQQKLPLLTSLTEKKKLIHSQGITTIIVLPFTSAFSTLGAEMFFQTYLKEKYGVSTLVIGKDHHMGSDRLGGEQLQVLARRLGMNVEILEDVQENGQRVSSTQLRKQVLRQQMLDKRLALSPEQWESGTQKIAQTLFRLPEFLEAPEIFAYCAIRKEVGTKEILQTARKLGKKVALPKITGTTMEFYYCQHFDELIPNRYGILEPTTTQLAVAETGLLLLPAVVADVHGYRIGYGGGYYDRYLAEHPEVFSIMLAFDMQIMEMLPRASFDVPARRVITETNGF